MCGESVSLRAVETLEGMGFYRMISAFACPMGPRPCALGQGLSPGPD